jgi:broad specificity phosphatase PhoE
MTSKERDAMLNPPLTALGYNQCAVLSRKFPYMDQITHVIVSPLRRTLETLHAAFGPVIDRETPVVVWQDVKEWGYGNCNRGAPRVILNKQLSTPNVDLSLLWPGYQNNRDSGSRRLKALQIRDALVDFTNVALVGGEWKGVPVAKAEDGKDVHLLVVSHGNIMSALVTSGANVIGINSFLYDIHFESADFVMPRNSILKYGSQEL